MGQRTGHSSSGVGVRQQNSRDQDRERELQHGHTDSGRGGEEAGYQVLDLRSEAANKSGQVRGGSGPGLTDRSANQGNGGNLRGWRGNEGAAISQAGGQCMDAIDKRVGEEDGGNDED